MPEVEGAKNPKSNISVVKKNAPPFETAENEMNEKDPALIAAWRRLLDYDRVSSWQKNLYQRIRQWVIVLTLMTSTLAVISTFVLNTDWNSQLGYLPSEIIRWILVILPVASVAFMNYAGEFATSTAWIEYRVSAEIIRGEIYRYRMKAGEYAGKSLHDRQMLLLSKVDTADDRIEEMKSAKSLPYIETHDADVIKQVREKTTSRDSSGSVDDGMSPMTIQEYINHRLENQLHWYIKKVKNDYSIARRDRRLILFVAASGSVLSGIGFGLEALAAITTAIGVAISTSSEMRMYGATYSIYHQTAARLQYAMDQWLIMPAEKKQTWDTIAKFAHRVEGIFDDEREQWRDQAVQTLQSNEQGILNTIDKKPLLEDDDSLSADLTTFDPLAVQPGENVIGSTGTEGAKG